MFLGLSSDELDAPSCRFHFCLLCSSPKTLWSASSFQFGLKLQTLPETFHVKCQLFSNLIPLFFVFPKRLGHDALQFSTDDLDTCTQHQRFGLYYRSDDVSCGFSRERQTTCNQFIDNNSQTPDVAALIPRPPKRLFGRDVAGRGQNNSWLRNLSFRFCFRIRVR